MKIAEIDVTFLEKLGTDITVVNAARVSFNKESELVPFCTEIEDGNEYCGGWDRTKCACIECNSSIASELRLSLSDDKLIKYLADHKHWSPFAHPQLSFRLKVPIFIARQLAKHQVGGVINEISRRYVDYEPEFWFPNEWHGKPVNKKQGCDKTRIIQVNEVIEFNNDWNFVFSPRQLVQESLKTYNEMIRIGAAPEEARIILPLNTMTEYIWTGSLYFFARIVNQRMSSDAQLATSLVAEQLYFYLNREFPISTKYLIKE